MKRDESLSSQIFFNLKLDLKKILNIHRRIRRKSKIKNYYKNHDQIKLHFGGGKDKLKDFLNTDVIGKIPVDIAKKLPFPTDTVDVIYSCHVIEHLYHKQFRIFIKESHRILKKGGIHVIMTPSLTRLIDGLYYNKENKLELLRGHEKFAKIKLDPAMIINWMPHLLYGHRFIHDLESINRVAKSAGYSIVRCVPFKDIPDAIVKEYAFMREKRGNRRWVLETETFLLIK